MSQTLRESIAIVIVAAFLALVYNWFSPRGLSLIRQHAPGVSASDSSLFMTSPADDSPGAGTSSIRQGKSEDTVGPGAVKVIAPLHERALAEEDSIEKTSGKKEVPEYRIVSLVQFKRLLQEHRGILIDARESEDYQRGHIKGARSIPDLEADKHFGELAPLPRDTLVLIYCSNAECPLGRALAHFMSIMSFTNLLLFDDGWDGWVSAGMPVDTTITHE